MVQWFLLEILGKRSNISSHLWQRAAHSHSVASFTTEHLERGWHLDKKVKSFLLLEITMQRDSRDANHDDRITMQTGAI